MATIDQSARYELSEAIDRCWSAGRRYAYQLKNSLDPLPTFRVLLESIQKRDVFKPDYYARNSKRHT
jgi:hypothetical protein